MMIIKNMNGNLFKDKSQSINIMKLENEIKLTFDDVMIKPKRSTLKSRNDVSLFRKFKFRHSPFTWEGVPIIAANMDTVGTLQMSNKLKEHIC